MVGGSFTPDALGPDRFNEVLDRAKTDPKRYLNTFVTTYLGGGFDAVTLSNLRLAVPFETLKDVAPEQTLETAQKTLRHLDGLLVIYDSATDKEKLRELLPDNTLALHSRLDRIRQRLTHLIEDAETPP